MPAAAIYEGWSWEDVVDAWTRTDPPEGWRTEITEQGITVTPPPATAHARIASEVHRALLSVLPSELSVVQNLGVRIDPARRLYIPDLAVVPTALLDDDLPSLSIEDTRLVVEITSRSSADADRVTKESAYARGGAPLYVLIDRYDDAGPTVTLFSGPGGPHYRGRVRVPFGDPITIPSPFDLELDTSGFPRPSSP